MSSLITLHLIPPSGPPALPPSPQVVEPVADVDVLLRRMTVVLAPSLWLEAWGMVVTEAALRGLPTLVSDAGGLPEAGLGCSVVVAVEGIQVPEDPATGTPDWSRRTYPTQQVREGRGRRGEVQGARAGESQGSQAGRCIAHKQGSCGMHRQGRGGPARLRLTGPPDQSLTPTP